MNHSPLTERHRPLAHGHLLVAAWILSACTSTPLPPWTGPAPIPPAAISPPATGAPMTAGQPPAVTATVPAPAATTFPPASARPAPPLPYSAAVAARYPAPSVVYATPGLQPDRTQFTTQAEIQSWLREQASAASGTPGVQASVVPIGRSQRGVTLEALVLTRAAGTDPLSLQATGRPTVLLVGQQHGDEPAGSEGLLVIARELAQGLLQPLLGRINVIIVPRANPDGEAAGIRATAGGLDMNRDHLLLNTPEVQALAALARDYRPTVVVDAHEYTVAGRFVEKFSAIQKFDALFQYATTPNLPEFLTKAAEEWYRRPLLSALKAQGLGSEWYYTTSSDLQDKKISMGGTLADTGRNVDGLKNAVSLLIETRGGGLGRLHIQRRVHTHVTAIMSVLGSTAQRAAELHELRPYLDKEVSGLACKNDAIIEAAPTSVQYELLMLDPLNGADKVVVVDWDSALVLRPVKTRPRPCGYWLSASATTAVERLRLHGVQVLRVTEAGSLLGDNYREISRIPGERMDVRGSISDANRIVVVQVGLTRSLIDVARGSYYVPLSQPMGNLVIAALEPDTQSSYFANRLLPDLQGIARVMAPPSLKLEELP